MIYVYIVCRCETCGTDRENQPEPVAEPVPIIEHDTLRRGIEEHDTLRRGIEDSGWVCDKVYFFCRFNKY